ncbi:MAG: AAA family ATPase, partial [Mycobacteriaceae bacterium]
PLFLTPDPVAAALGQGWTRVDGTSMFTRADDQRYSHPLLLDAEQALLHANTHPEPGTPTVGEALARHVAELPQPGRGIGTAVRLAPDQIDAIVTIGTSNRLVDVLVGPAGTGKTTTLIALRLVWEATHGPGSVIGLAPSATAAAELGAALGVPCENTAKWLHDTSRDGSAAWGMRAGQLVIIDEASLAATLTLDQLRTQAQKAGAKLLLVGDHQQLSAVGAGGVFGLLARRGDTAHLHSLWRFTHRWEADATRALRAGNPTCLDTYDAHGRLHAGPTDALVETAYAAWAADTDAGLSSVLLAGDARTVQELNTRAHTDRVATGQVTGPTIPLGDQDTGGQRGRVGVGDLVITRHNDRTLTYPGGHVRNGTLWTISAVHSDGSVGLATIGRDRARHGQPVIVTVPASYVAEHLDLGYAVTVHHAQGITVDTSHVLVGPGTDRQQLYVAMTRGREQNHTYLGTDTPDPTCEYDTPRTEPVAARALLEAILAQDRTELSGTEAREQATTEAGSLHRLTRVRATVLGEHDHSHGRAVLHRAGVDPEQIQEILSSPACGALFAVLGRATRAGHDSTTLLTSMTPPPGADRDGVEDLAAVLHHRISTYLEPGPTGTDVGSGGPDRGDLAMRLGLIQCTSPRAPHADPELAAVEELIADRLDTITINAINNRPSWLPPAPDPGAPGQLARSWIRSVAVVAAHRDQRRPPRPGHRAHDLAMAPLGPMDVDQQAILDALDAASTEEALTDDRSLYR